MSFPQPGKRPVNAADPLFRETLPDATAVTTDSIFFVGSSGSVFYLKFAGNGKYFIDVKLFGDFEQIAKGSVKTNEPKLVKIDTYIPEARVRFEPAAATSFPAELKISSFGYPVVFTRP